MWSLPTKPSLNRDFLLLSVLILFALVMVSIWIVYKTYINHSQSVMQRLENEAVRIDRSLIIKIEEASYLLESISRQLDSSQPTEPQLIRLFNAFSKNPALRSNEFHWVDSRQRMTISSTQGKLDKPIELADRDYVKRALLTPWKAHIGQPIQSRLSGRWVIPIAMGITNSREEFLGIVSITLDIDELSRVITHDMQETNIDFAITNEAFTLLTQVADEDDFFSRYFSLSELSTRDFANEPSGIYSVGSWFEDQHIYAYYETSSQYPFIIFVGYNPAVNQSAMREILLPRLLQIFVMSLFLILTLWIVRKRIIAPVIALTHASRRILQNKPFAHDASRDPLEIEQLAHEIARLEQYVAERRRIEREITRKNAALMEIKNAAELTNHLKADFFEQVGEALMEPAKAIGEYIESLRNELFGPLGDDKYHEMAEEMYRECIAIIDTLSDIRAISRAESGLLALQESPLDINFLIKKCVRLLRESAAFQSVEVICDLDESLPKLQADELRVKQLLLNVLTVSASELDSGDTLRVQSLIGKRDIRVELTYKPVYFKPADDMLLPYRHTDRAIPTASFLKLGNALSNLIIAMHGGEISTKALPDNYVKKIITFPRRRTLAATESP